MKEKSGKEKKKLHIVWKILIGVVVAAAVFIGMFFLVLYLGIDCAGDVTKQIIDGK